MSKKMKVLVAVLVAMLLLTVGGAAAVMADNGSTSTSNTTSTNSLLARVADKLGITEEELANAFREARQEIRGEAFIRYLDKAVEEGLITQEEADEIKEWWVQKPEAFERLSPRRFLGKALHNRHMWGAQRGMSEEALGQAANRIMERWQNRLENPKQMFTPGHFQQALRGQHRMVIPKGWQGTIEPEPAD
jgi:hypothetical protein